MNKRGQFFLIMSFIILGLIAGVVTVANSADKKTDPRFNYVKDELNLESEKVIDYSISNDGDIKADLTTFAQDYSTYSNADDFYYVFGTTTGITFAGLKKKSQGSIQINYGSGDQTVILNQGEFRANNDYTPLGTSVNLTINNIKYPFTLRAGENFFFVVSKEVEGDVYVATNS